MEVVIEDPSEVILEFTDFTNQNLCVMAVSAKWLFAIFYSVVFGGGDGCRCFNP